MPIAGTVIARRDLARARVLAGGLARHMPAVALVVLLLDDPGREAVRETEPFELLAPEDVLADLGEFLTEEPAALPAQLAPRLAQALLARDEGDVLLLDAAVDVLAPLDVPAAPAAWLVPRLLEPVPADGERPSEAEIAAAGLYRSGQLGIAATDAGAAFAAWWAAQAGRGGDGGDPLDRAPLLFDGVAVARDRRLGMAAWNLHARDVRDAITLYLPDFDPLRPHWLGGRASRVRAEGALAERLDDYAVRLLAAGHADADPLAWGFAALPNGLPLDRPLRAVLAQARRAGVEIGDPFTAAGSERLLAYAAGPAEEGADWGVSRYIHALWRGRPDLRDAYPELGGEHGEDLVRWVIAHGEDEGIPAALRPPDPDAGGTHALGVNIAGYLASALGIGEAGRLYAVALQAADVPLRTDALDPPRPDDERERRAPPALGGPGLDAGVDHPLNLICVNAPQLPGFARQLGTDYFLGHRSIGVWAWETSEIPPAWDEAFRWVDEIWTYSTYGAGLIAPRAPVPVVAMPLPLVLPAPAREPLELPLRDGFTFLFIFDFLSTVERKNPVALVEAFTRAFAPGEGPQLVLKAFNGDYRPEHLERLRRAARGRDDVLLVNRWISAEQRRALMERADCYVSLHRSEGFGLTLAEAMGLGKPVIATGYSGNLDFMDAGTAYLVDHTLVPVGPGVEIYPEDGVWAEPDVEHAAALMRRVFEQPAEAAGRAARGRERVLRQLSPAACGARARARLERLLDELPPRTAAADDLLGRVALDAAVHQASYDPDASATGAHPKELARRGALQAMRPYTHHQQELNQRLVAPLVELHEETSRRLWELERRARRARRVEWRVRNLEARDRDEGSAG
jgi:glycosyltransferase involved in cell wall biosynthesis